MRRVDRSLVSAPAVLVGDKSRGGKELAKATVFFEAQARAEAAAATTGAPAAAPKTRTKKENSFEFSAYSDEAVKYALDKLFFGKCAYCESRYANQAPVDVEHYRPKGRIAGVANHPGYWLLAMVWDNLLPSCIDCNRRRWQDLPQFPESLAQLLAAPEMQGVKASLGKQDLFPIAGAARATAAVPGIDEQPDLINPCVDDPAEHLVFHVDRGDPLGLVLPAFKDDVPSRRGLTSIHVYGLNRLGLVQERTRILRKLDFLSRLVDEIGKISETLLASRDQKNKTMGARLDLLLNQILDEIRAMAEPDQPYSSLVKAWSKTLETK
ncbi:endonuclease [Rhizobium sp. WYCCWR 11290]|uniref:Endonuclease n=1 Tax=Rhizobium changzhiense TaxID=2692317 RepID=A0A7Z0U9P4_9HYPH|nr:endonuclease [Rhizobium changzhiense]NZD63149.1 endonuclease [Rhizobium changzhiense]